MPPSCSEVGKGGLLLPTPATGLLESAVAAILLLFVTDLCIYL